MQIAAASTEYIRVPVSATEDGAAVDVTVDTVEMGFIKVSSRGAPTTWYPAAWETVGAAYNARCLVGPDSDVPTFTVGTWEVWVKVTDSPEIPVLRSGTLEVS